MTLNHFVQLAVHVTTPQSLHAKVVVRKEKKKFMKCNEIW